jgi:regulator of sigma E protease
MEGLADLLMIMSAISMSLCFMNLLPIPPLDGGKVLIEIINLIRRKPLSKRAELVVSYIGIAFFLFVFIYVLRLDIIRFVMG